MRILVFHEKYGDRYLKASTKEEMQESCHKVLKERFESSYWGYKPIKPIWPEKLTRDQIKNMPEPYRGIELEKERARAREFQEYEEQVQWYEDTKREVRAPQGKAYQLLCFRVDGEYEGFKIESVE